MKIEIDLDDAEIERLQQALGPETDLEVLTTTLAQAGAQELLAQATGVAVFSSISDLRLFRVFQLLRAGISLDDAQTLIAKLFKVTPARARGLLQAALARYDIELRNGVGQLIHRVLDSATWQDQRWEVGLPIGFVRDQVLEAATATDLADPERAGRGSVWKLPDETYQAVRLRFGLEERPKP